MPQFRKTLNEKGEVDIAKKCFYPFHPSMPLHKLTALETQITVQQITCQRTLPRLSHYRDAHLSYII